LPSFAVLFPGQGSQFPGMGADLFAARPDLLGARADYVLGWSLRQMCLDTPEEVLTRTEHAQPAIFALTYALWEELRARLPRLPAAGAGHSLGEYTALVAAGALDFDEGLALVAERGAAMAAAADLEPSGMAALLGASVEEAEKVCAERAGAGGRLSVANINAPGQVVVAGGEEDLTWLEAEAGALGIRRVVRLKVAGAFHSPFMAPAARRVETALAGVQFHPPAFPVWSNVTAQPFDGDVAALLSRQVESPVQFAGILEGMAAVGIELFVHVGPGEVTAGMARRAAPGAEAVAVSDLQGIAAVVAPIGSIH
jgi:malonyl CoA-acyl carrier protein transacylase